MVEGYTRGGAELVGVEENVSIYCVEQMDESFSRKYGLNFLENLSKNRLVWERNNFDCCL